MTSHARRTRTPRSAATPLLGADPFVPPAPGDEQLTRLVVATARSSPAPFATLLAQLFGSPRLNERLARDVWSRAVDHRRRLGEALGRPIDLRVAALDLLLDQGLLPRPLLVDRALVDALVDEAGSDPLTGLPNRCHFTTVLEHEVRQRRRPSVAVLEVDGFERANDLHGQARGDAVLRGLAEALRSGCRRGDLAARLGGDEFGVVFVGADEATARKVLRRIDRSFRDAQDDDDLGLCFGVAGAGEGADPATLLQEASRRLYALKRGRRRRDRPAPSAVALYATQSADRFLAVHEAFAAAGMLVVPARTASVAQALAPMLASGLVMSDLLFPPRGGLALLAVLETRGPAGARLVVAPERWRGLGRGMPDGIELLAYPPGAAAVRQVVRRFVPPGAEPFPTVDSQAGAQALLAAVEHLVGGHVDPAAAATADRPEVELVRSLLGG